MTAYRQLPDDLRAQLHERRRELRERARRYLTARKRRALGATLSRELEELEHRLERFGNHDPSSHVEQILDAYDRALDAATEATRQRAARSRPAVLLLLAAAFLPSVRGYQVLRSYPAVAQSCATHFHCAHAGECSVELFLNTDHGASLRCAGSER